MNDQRGATIVEYAMLLVLILVMAAGVYRQLGKDTRKAGDMTVGQFHNH